jgi:protein SCO1
MSRMIKTFSIVLFSIFMLIYLLWYFIPNLSISFPKKNAIDWNEFNKLNLVNENNSIVDFNQFKNDTVLLFFGYTHCPDMCPIALKTIIVTINHSPIKNIRGVFISIDPKKDSPEKLKKFLQYFPSKKLIGVTGTYDSIIQLAERFHIQSKINTNQKEYFLDHTNSIFYIKDSILLKQFSGNISSDTLAIELQENISIHK